MSELYPKPTRLALLRDVADGLVCFSPQGGGVQNLAYTPPRVVVAGTAELRRAGWITVEIADGADVLGSYYYELTDAGRAVLDTHGGQQT